jgi:23S rRNA (uracil1939-C5)-methyltransferase
MHLVPPAQERLKAGIVLEAVKELWPSTVPFIPAPAPYGYRCRTTYVAQRKKNSVRLGSYSPRSHDVARMDGCLVLRPTIARVAAELSRMLFRVQAPIHPEPQGLRFVSVRSAEPGQAVAEFIVNAEGAEEWAVPLGQSAVRTGLLQGLSLSVNEKNTNAIKIAASTCLAGGATVTDRVAGLELELEAGGFSQLNLEVASAMYRKAAQLAGRAETLWDLYSGPGALGLTVAAKSGAKKLMGAESVQSSVLQARRVAQRLGVNARYETCDLALGVPNDWPIPDVALVNPPRRGLDQAVSNRLVDTGPRVIVYMSCHPRSFATDAKVLVGAGYRITDLEAHDMLPQTAHVELLARLEK